MLIFTGVSKQILWMQQEEGQEILKKQEIQAGFQVYLSGTVSKDIELY